MKRIISNRHEQAILGLLDDPSPVVREELLKELRRLEDVGVSLMRKALREQSGGPLKAAEYFLQQLTGPDPVTAVVEFIHSLHYELETGMILLSRVLHPDMPVETIHQPLGQIARRVREVMPVPASGWERCKAMNRVLFHEFGFRGNAEDYEDPYNSFMHTVLRRRKGIPVSLTVLYLLVAERCGLEVVPIAIPGHFLVGCFLDGEPFYLDAYNRGRLIGHEDLREYLTRLRVHYDPQWLSPATASEVLCRVCRNLSHHFYLKNSPRNARIFSTFVKEFEDTHRRHSELG
jgi:regulator of sirC expression with transglutaminase-like and TPR domain